jgi:hypothetical protein
VAELHPTPGSRRATPSSCREASSGVAIRDTEEGAKGGKKRHNQRLQEVIAVANDDGGNNEEAGGSGVVCVMTAAGGGKCQARPHTDHLERLFKEDCPNHVYPVKYKLRDCDMMKSFMVSGSLTWGMELDEVPDEGDATPFLGEDAVMTMHDRDVPRV